MCEKSFADRFAVWRHRKTAQGAVAAKRVADKWFGLADYQKKQKRLFDAAMAEFASLLAQEHIPYVVFKGLAAGAKYPQPELRTMGDIDFYVPPSDFDRAVDVIERYLISQSQAGRLPMLKAEDSMREISGY